MKGTNTKLYIHKAKGKNTGTCIIICPGGSYHHLGLYNEGYTTAKWFSERGVTAFVLRYRTAQNGHHYPPTTAFTLPAIWSALLFASK